MEDKEIKTVDTLNEAVEQTDENATDTLGQLMCGTSSNFNYNYEDTFIMDDIEARKLYINHPVTRILNDTITYHIIRYNEMDKDIPIEERLPIRIFINTEGGSELDGMACISAMLMSKTPIWTISTGYMYSMGFPLFLGGSRRFITPEATVMNHDGSLAIAGDICKVYDNIEFYKRLQDRLDKYIIARTNLTLKDLSKARREDKFWFADEAYNLGIATDIIGQTCDLDEIL